MLICKTQIYLRHIHFWTTFIINYINSQVTLSTASPTKITPPISVNKIITNSNTNTMFPWKSALLDIQDSLWRLSHKEDTPHKTISLPPGRSWAPSVCSNIAMGIPTFFDLPATTTFFPRVGIPMKKYAYLHKSNARLS